MPTDAPQTPLNAYGAAWGPPLISTFIAAIDGFGWLALVAVIFVLDSTAMGLFMYCVYYYSILSWGMPEMLNSDIKEFPASTEYILTTFLALIVQCFYINTIRALRAPIIITVLLFLAALTAFITGLILPAVQLKLVSIQRIVVSPLNHLAFNIARGTALACDFGIVVVLFWLFASRKTGVRRANNMLDALIMFSVQRGVLQAIVQTGEVLAYAIKPDGLYFLPFHVIVSRIYCNSLLATLNSRDYVLSKGLSEHERARKQRIHGGNPDPEVGNDRNVAEDQARERERERAQVQEEKRIQILEAPAPPRLTAVTTESESTGRWASTVSGTQQILSSFLEPPFLYTNESFALASRGVRSTTGDSNSVSVIRSFSGSEVPMSIINTNTGTGVGTSRFADSERSNWTLEKAQSMSSMSVGSESSIQASASAVTPGSKDRAAIEEHKIPST